MTSRILYVEGNLDGTVGGSYYILLDLVLGLDRSRYEPIVLFHHENLVADRLRQAGVRVVIQAPPTPFVFRLPLLNSLLEPVKKFINFLRGFVLGTLSSARFLRHERIDLVNLNNSITTNHPWMAASLITGTPCITHEMGINQHYSWLSRALGARLDAIICLSQAILEAMRAGGAASPNTVVIHSLFDPKRYGTIESPEQLRQRHLIPDGAPVIGVVGNVKAWKGQETIVRATHLLRPRYPKIRCVLAGGTSPRDLAYLRHLESLCAELGITENVIFAGFQPNPIDYMGLMDVVVHTSTSPEPFGIVLLEAMLAAKPLISTTIGGPAEIVVQGETGLLVDPGEPTQLAAAIESLLEDPAASAEMGRKGQHRLRSEFALERTLAETVALYERVRAARSGGRRSGLAPQAAI